MVFDCLMHVTRVEYITQLFIVTRRPSTLGGPVCGLGQSANIPQYQTLPTGSMDTSSMVKAHLHTLAYAQQYTILWV
ncbi:RNA polymerase sigma factor RpoD [Anopheles sinensis]|uniref:RNA polymerase sigma factor RpoD n=1 Tax=Anopheles sinensis TaxID=74873 RepID=A0A084VST5_ANOSI|nr:RNA polymerase sigma factor RpoD [Anopheles sinensis]